MTGSRNVDRITQYAVLAGLSVISTVSAYLLDQDVNWDLRNYHCYNGNG